MANDPAQRPPRVEVLQEAAELIDGDRNLSYGTPTQNFTNIAEMWTTYLKHKLKDGETLAASDVADLMILLKIARNIASKKKDTYADAAGYAGCGYEAMLEEQKPKLKLDPEKFARGGIVRPDDEPKYTTINGTTARSSLTPEQVRAMIQTQGRYPGGVT